MDKFLIVGLGNVGDEYDMTRHNTGFMVLDAFAKASNIHFDDKRYGFVAETSLKGRKVFLLKPSTFMNLSGNAVRYWLNKENIEQSRLLVISDDVALPLGAFRLKAGGSNGGHNGLGHIQQLGVRSQEEAFGKSDFDFCANQDDAQRFYNDEQQIIKSKKPILNQIQKEHRLDTIIYTSTSKYPLFDTSGNVVGTFGLTTDVTNAIMASRQENENNG